MKIKTKTSSVSVENIIPRVVNYIRFDFKVLLAKIFYSFGFDFVSEVNDDFDSLVTLKPKSELKIIVYDFNENS